MARKLAHKVFTGFLLILGLSVVPNLARADSATFVFDVTAPPSFTGTPPPAGTPPWGTVTLSLSANGTVSLDANASTGFSFNEFAVNTVAGTAVSGVPVGWTVQGACFLAFGCFNDNLSDAGAPLATSILLILTGSSPFASVFDAITPSTPFQGSPTELFVAGIVDSSTRTVGIAAVAPVPEPSILVLLASGLAAVIGLKGRPGSK